MSDKITASSVQIDLMTYEGDPSAILALPGAVPPAQAPANLLVVVVVDRGSEEAERNEYQLSMQDSARYDVTLGHRSEASNEWETVGWNWEQDHFGSGGRRVVAAFPNAGLAEINNPLLLPRRSVSEATPSSSPAQARARIIPYTAEDDATPDPAMNGLVMLAIGQDGDVPDHVLDRIPAEAADTLIRLLSAARAVAPAGVPEHAANVARTLGEFADALDADEPLNTENLIDAMRDAVDALLSPTPTAQGQDTEAAAHFLIAHSLSQGCDRFVWRLEHDDPDGGIDQWVVEVRPNYAKLPSAPSTSAGEA